MFTAELVAPSLAATPKLRVRSLGLGLQAASVTLTCSHLAATPKPAAELVDCTWGRGRVRAKGIGMAMGRLRGRGDGRGRGTDWMRIGAGFGVVSGSSRGRDTSTSTSMGTGAVRVACLAEGVVKQDASLSPGVPLD